jgi:DNA-binding MarR family transcriptional regulator
MIVCNFNLSSTQIQVLLTFRAQADTRSSDRHPMMDVEHTVSTLRKLCKENYLEWHPGEGKKCPPGYRLTPKGEMMLRVIQDELRRSLDWFEEPASLPKSAVNGREHDLATGKAEVTPKGRYRRVKSA